MAERDRSLYWGGHLLGTVLHVDSPTAQQLERRITVAPRKVLVGCDGTPGSAVAIEWAMREVTARGAVLRIGGRTSRSLVDEAGEADLLVLSASPEKPAEQVLLGSLARKAMRRSPCPVVVVRGSRTGPVRSIVLGVDGSSAAATALDWACHEADLHQAQLLVIHSAEKAISQAEATCVVDLAVNECRERTFMSVRGLLARESAASALIGASQSADLVVIGSRGRSGFKTAVFGSVALSVAEKADCPVAVTHPAARPD